MEAVVKIGGRQYRVEKGQRVSVDRLSAEVGASVKLDQVLMLTDGAAVTVGRPVVEGASVEAKVLAATRGPKILVFKYKPKKRYRRTQGHRSALSVLEVTGITGPGGATKARSKKAATADVAVEKEEPV